MAGTRLILDMAAVEAVLRDPPARAVIQDATDQFVAAARGFAAHRTGAGAASIHGEISDSDSGLESDVSWDEDHRYMRFQEFGTTHMAPHPALQPALDRYAQF